MTEKVIITCVQASDGVTVPPCPVGYALQAETVELPDMMTVSEGFTLAWQVIDVCVYALIIGMMVGMIFKAFDPGGGRNYED